MLLLGLAKMFTLSLCMVSGFPGGFILPLLFTAGAFGEALHLALPFIPQSVAMLCIMGGMSGALMRMPIGAIILLQLLTGQQYLPVIIVACLSGYLLSTYLQAANVRQALKEAEEQSQYD